MLPRFEGTPLWVDAAAVLVAAVAVWTAGVRLARGADAIARRTGLRQAVVGVLLLAVATSLPEIAVTATAALGGNSALAVNNLLGGLAMQVTILALADAVLGRDALTAVVADPSVLLQGILCALLLAVAAAGITLGDVPAFGVGIWAWAIAAGYPATLWLVARTPRASTQWVVESRRGEKTKSARARRRGAPPNDGEVAEQHGARHASFAAVVARTALAGLVILAAGVVLARAGEGIATKTGLGESFVGAVLVAGSTSLPEVSTVFGAVRLRRYEMAVADIFGTNLADVALLPVVDALSAGPPVLGEMGRFSTAAALLALTLTLVFLAGLIERRDRTVLRMGVDSLLVLLLYAGGLVLLYHLR
jgi:cation:H+ antiporter